MDASAAADRLRDLRQAVESGPCLDLPMLVVGKMYFATVYPHKGCGFRIMRKSPSSRVVMGRNVMQDDAPPIKLPKAHIERSFYGESQRGYYLFTDADFQQCLELAKVVQRGEPATA